MRTCPKCKTSYPDDVAYCLNDGTQITMLDTMGDAGSSDPRVGSILGSYRIHQLLGEGGMGSVYLAEHTRLGRKVALKMLHPEYAKDANAVRRFFGEARSVNQINHEHIVEITDFIEDSDENYYIMELLRGHDLSQLLQREHSLKVQRMLAIMLQVTSALAAVHKSGIVHRDLKPENIFLIERGGSPDFVKLLDFGIAKLMSPDGENLVQTKTGAIMGTPMYMSPEQLTGKPIDYRTDIYAVGVILYEAVVGRRPYHAKTVGELVIKQMTEPFDAPNKILKDAPVPPDLEALILQCLDQDPNNRPQTMAGLHTQLAALAAGRKIDVAKPPRVSAGRRGGAARMLVGLGIAALLAGAGYVAWEKVGPGAPTPVPTVSKVTLTLSSNPPAAEVYRVGETAPVGLTPLEVSLPQSDQAVSYTFKLKGHMQETRQVVPSANQSVVVAMSKKATPTPTPVARKKKRNTRKKVRAKMTPKPTPTPKKKIRKGNVMDPFAD